ncbi:MAG: 4Fe-4S binding protein [Acidaminococcaceae bacterium]
MEIQKVSKVFFSPTASTYKVLNLLTTTWSVPMVEFDLTCFAARKQTYNFAASDFVVLGFPVYGGRIPAPMVTSMKQLQGNQTPVVLVATYGNRAYDDALLEGKTLLEEQGFVVVAAAAFVTEHSIMHSVATGRPDAQDRLSIATFARQVWDKFTKLTLLEGLPRLTVKGNPHYREYKGVPLKPQTTSACTQCGLCVSNCPVNAISAANPRQTEEAVCISCLRCIQVCPVQARKLNKMLLFAAEKMFACKNSARQEPEIFL